MKSSYREATEGRCSMSKPDYPIDVDTLIDEALKPFTPVSRLLKMHMQEETVVEVEGCAVSIRQEDSSGQIGTQYMTFTGAANLDAFIGMLTEARKAIS